MADQTLQFNLNLNLKQGNNTVDIRAVDKFAYNMENMIIDNVAFVIAKGQQAALQRVLSSEIALIVEKELSRMGRQIDQYVVGISDKSSRTSVVNKQAGGRATFSTQSGPAGQLGIVGARSQAFRDVNMGPFTISDGTGPWPARSPTYLAQKRKRVGHTKWFETTGRMRKELRDPTTYTSAYGPVRVSFKKETLQNPKGQTVTKMSSGVAGGSARQVAIGQVRVSVLGRITNDMLSDPGKRQPSAWKTGLFGSLAPDLEAKLLNREDAYRPFLETFLSFYLTRAVPNAVFRRLEEVVKSRAGVAPSAKRYSSRNLISAQQSLKIT